MKKLLLLFCCALLVGQSYAQTYELDNSYVTGTGFDAEVNASGIDSNGEVLFGGDFTDYNGTTRNYLARLNADGTVDTGFDPSSNLSASITSLAMHSNNSVTVVTAGTLKRFDNVAAEFSGAAFTPDAANNVINVVAAETTGFIVVIGGAFTDVGGTTANRIARLNADGTLNATFATNIGTGFNGTVRAIEITSSGKILVGGDFTTFNNITRSKIALLNSDGTLDTNFVPGNNTNPLSISVYSVAMQDDGKILAGTYGGSGYARLARMKADGTEDFYGSISTGTYVTDIHVNGTNDIIIGGWFDYGFSIRDFTDGSNAASPAGNGVEGTGFEVNTVSVQADGAIILGGLFTSYNGISTTNVVRIAACDVSIDTQPSSITTCETNNDSFSVVASGTGTLNYQWQVNTASGSGVYTDIVDDATYSGATTATLDLTNVTSGIHGYYYRCIVTDDNCSTTSGVVTLTVTATQVLTQDPSDIITCLGYGAFFDISYTGTSGGWQWQEDPGTGVFADIADGGIYSGVTNSTLNLTGLTVDMTGYKYRLVSSACGAGYTSASGTLTINEYPEIIEQPSPVSQANCLNGNATFTVVATHANTIGYQWQYRVKNTNTYVNLADAGVYSGTNTTALTVTGADNTLAELYDDDNSDGKTFAIYRCVLTADACPLNSAIAYLNIYDAPTISADPEDVTKCDSGNGVAAAFHVTSSLVVGGFPYQWQVDDGTGFVNINDDAIYSGTNSKDLMLTAATSALNGYEYRCEIGACAAPVYSSGALLTIDDKPVLVQGPGTASICEDGDVTFTVEATGNNLIYQWQEQTFGSSTYVDIVNNAIYSALGATLDISSAPLAMNNYRYRCVISSATSCEITVGNALLKVYAQPTLSLRTDNVTTVCEGGTTTFRVNPSASTTTAIAAGVYNYQWQSDNGIGVFTNISDDDNYTDTNNRYLIIDNPPLSFSGMQYRCIFSGCVTENASEPETLTVLQLPLVTTSPQSQTICRGEQVTFTAEATGSDITYTWWRNTGDGTYSQVKGASATPDYIFTADISFDGYKYKSIATAGTCSTTAESFEATLTVQDTQLTAASTQSLQICAGETAKFGVEVSNLDGLTFQWSDSNGDLTDDAIYSGVTNDTLTITAPSTAQNNYSVAITGACGNTSTSFSLLVYGLETPIIEPQLGDPNNPQLFVSTNFQLGVDNFEWFLNGSSYQSSGANPIITIDQAGSYTVVPNRNGCNHPESEAVVIVITGFENTLSANEISFYPNPVSNKLTLEMGDDFNLINGAKVVITNVSGKEVYNRSYGSLNMRKTEVDMSSYESGIYLVRVINGDKIAQYKVRKQ